MATIEPVALAMPILSAVVSRDGEVSPDSPSAVLGDLAAGWLRAHGQGPAWEDYSRNPQNDSLVKHLLTEATQQDDGFMTRFEKAVAAAKAEQTQQPTQQIVVNGSGHAQIGDSGDTVTGTRVATRGSTYNETHNRSETHNRTQNTRVNKKANPAVIVAGVIVLILVILLIKGIAGAIGHPGNTAAGLTASSTCQQFLNTDENTEQQALVDIADSKGIGGFGSPLALPEIRYECSYSPSMTLGKLIERDRNDYG
jgi:hypothetical protein